MNWQTWRKHITLTCGVIDLLLGVVLLPVDEELALTMLGLSALLGLTYFIFCEIDEL